MNITFYVPDEEEDIDSLSQIDPDRDWKILKKGQRWIVQTYLRLKKIGMPVFISKEIPLDGIVIFHKRNTKELANEIILKKRNHLILVGVRSDKSQLNLADFELVQNDRWEDNKRIFYIPYWPQPGLIKRNLERGTKVERIAFKGFNTNLHSYFFRPKWKYWLKQNGMEWKHDSMNFYKSEENGVSVDWHDYENVDVILALRPDPVRKDQKEGFTAKPATKLYNSWIAGVPAILPDEYAFKRLKKSELDYLTIKKPWDAKKALLKLKEDPDLYRSMVENGLKRGSEFSVENISMQWEDFFKSKLPPLVNTYSFKLSRKISPKIRMHFRRVKRMILFKSKR